MYVRVWKRVLDIVLFCVAFPFWLVILAVIGPMIYFEDKGPIFYIAPRLGKDGKVFYMYKFRSMKVNSLDIRIEDGSTYNGEDDDRLTKIGKSLRRTSLDETPQLLNIIKGEMSIIGPRPDLPEDIDSYTGDQKLKLELRPGVTGYSQAYYRNSILASQKYNNDVYYIQNISFLLDLRLFFKTAKIVMLKEKIFSSEIKDPN